MNTRIGLLLVVTSVALWFLLPPRQAAVQGPGAVPKWEYKVLSNAELFDEGGAKMNSRGSLAPGLEAGLNRLGKEGWELVSFQDSGYWALKRLSTSRAK
jgi:hypothetical protein